MVHRFKNNLFQIKSDNAKSGLLSFSPNLLFVSSSGKGQVWVIRSHKCGNQVKLWWEMWPSQDQNHRWFVVEAWRPAVLLIRFLQYYEEGF